VPYITCTRKKSHARVSIKACARYMVKYCPDYKVYCQPRLFASFVPDKAIKIYHRIYHEVMNEPEHDPVLSYMEE